MREITITLSSDVAHRLEILAARDDNRLATGIENLLTYLVGQFERIKQRQGSPFSDGESAGYIS